MDFFYPELEIVHGWHKLSVFQVFYEIIGENIPMLRVKHKRSHLYFYYRWSNTLFVVSHSEFVIMNNYYYHPLSSALKSSLQPISVNFFFMQSIPLTSHYLYISLLSSTVLFLPLDQRKNVRAIVRFSLISVAVFLVLFKLMWTCLNSTGTIQTERQLKRIHIKHCVTLCKGSWKYHSNVQK